MSSSTVMKTNMKAARRGGTTDVGSIMAEDH
jgi:hypothetical protein